MLQPDANHCIGDGPLAQAPDATTGACATSAPVALGNAASYSYSMTPVIGPGTTYPSATCVGLTVTSDKAIGQRCITAIGTANGVTARSEIRVASFAATPVFPIAGMTGYKSIADLNNSTITGIVASNGKITQSNGATVSGVEVGPSGSFANSNQSPAPGVGVLGQPITIGQVDPGSSAINTPLGGSCVPQTGVQQTNCDYRISNYLSNPSACGSSLACDPSSKITFNTATRTLTMNNGATLTLGGGIYNFCELDAPNNATISLAPNVHAAIYIDSPADPNSGCPTTKDSSGNWVYGHLNLSNNVTWTNLSQDPTALQLYVYGDPSHPGANVVNFTNNTVFWGVLFAPSSTVSLSNSSNNSAFWGAITGYAINTSNNYHFNWLASAGTIQAQSQGVYYRTAWSQCVPTPPVATSPGSGCG
jgi:hypothetical protein